ncbi:MAG TPA: type II secretion system F family protein [Bacillota bacterium]|nr:type II secretion system F family protein [Bacillota bacterium]
MSSLTDIVKPASATSEATLPAAAAAEPQPKAEAPKAVKQPAAKRGFFGSIEHALMTPHKGRLPFKEREFFTENLALLLKSAVPIGDALNSLSESVKNKVMKDSLAAMRADVDAGYSLANALERTGLATGQTLALVRLGEDSGHLVENLELAAQQEAKRHVFKAKVRSALIYPAFVMSLTVIIGLGVAWFLLPRLSNTFSQLQVHLPPVSKFMINGGVFLKAHGIVAVPLFFLALGLIGYILFAAPKTKHIGNQLLFKVPGVGRLMSEVEIAQFGYLLGTLLNAGLPVTQSLKLLQGATSSVQYKAFYAYMADALDQGYSFKDSLRKYKGSQKLLPGAVQQMIIAGERSGSLSEVLITVGKSYEQKSDITTANLEAIIEPIMLVIVWMGVMLVAVAVIMPIYSLVGGLNK